MRVATLLTAGLLLLALDASIAQLFSMGLKGMAQAKIIKKSVILFWLLNITI